MTISAKVIADSKVGSTRLTTMVLRYPRFIHAEFMTHRVFSRNASSSRAIPVQKMIEQVENDPAMPVWWGKNQAGMQAREALDPQAQEKALIYWHAQRYAAINHAHMLVSLGVHKQLVNRILEPWQHIEVVVTSTDWANFYALRDHPDAQPEIQALAQAMYAAHQSSTPVELSLGDWHLPFIAPADRDSAQSYLKSGQLRNALVESVCAKLGVRELQEPTTTNVLLAGISAARCARVSYLKHDNSLPSIDEDLELFNRLMGGTPKHASPAEHQACNMAFPNRLDSNLRNVAQFRKMIEGECIREYKEFTS